MKRTKYARRKRDLAYMAWIRSLACVCCGTRSYVEAAHVGPKAFGQKCPDRQTLPLCRTHHRIGRDSVHVLGRKFWTIWNLDRDQLIRELNDAYETQVLRRAS